MWGWGGFVVEPYVLFSFFFFYMKLKRILFKIFDEEHWSISEYRNTRKTLKNK